MLLQNKFRIKLTGHVECLEKIIISHKSLVEKPQVKRPPVRRRYRCENSIKRVLTEVCTMLNYLFHRRQEFIKDHSLELVSHRTGKFHKQN